MRHHKNKSQKPGRRTVDISRQRTVKRHVAISHTLFGVTKTVNRKLTKTTNWHYRRLKKVNLVSVGMPHFFFGYIQLMGGWGSLKIFPQKKRTKKQLRSNPSLANSKYPVFLCWGQSRRAVRQDAVFKLSRYFIKSPLDVIFSYPEIAAALFAWAAG